MAFDFSDLGIRYEAVLGVVAEDLASIKTGRAKPALVEKIEVQVYGTRMPIMELGSISAPDPQLLLIQVWDQSVVEAVEKALFREGMSPAVDGQVVRVTVAPLTGEKREELVRGLGQKIESGRQMIREERGQAKREIDASKDQPGVSEDDIKSESEELEKLTREYMEKLDEMGKKKEEELRRL